jgi:hypothetical protein
MKIKLVTKSDLRLYKVRRNWRIEGKKGENMGAAGANSWREVRN